MKVPTAAPLMTACLIIFTHAWPTTNIVKTSDSRIDDTASSPSYYSYFNEDSPDSQGYDARYASEPLSQEERRAALKTLHQTYLMTFQDLGICTWLMHKSLLGWWWGKQILPFESSGNAQVMEADLYHLAAYHNMTVYYYEHDNTRNGKFFQLEVSPFYQDRAGNDDMNTVDARWIDMHSGLYIDIAAARYKLDGKPGDGMLADKNGHEFKDTLLFPLRETIFEGVPVLIPFAYRDILTSEYGAEALLKIDHEDHQFDQKAMSWVPSSRTQKPL